MWPAIAVVGDCCQTSAAQTGIRFRFRRRTQLQPAPFYEHRFPLFYKACVPPGRERRACCAYLNQGHGLSPLPPGENNDAQLSAQSRTLRIRQSCGLNFSSANSTSLLRAVAILLWVIFIRFRGPQALNDNLVCPSPGRTLRRSETRSTAVWSCHSRRPGWPPNIDVVLRLAGHAPVFLLAL